MSFKHIFFLWVALILIFQSEAYSKEIYPRRNAIVNAVETAGPAVVNINTEEVIKRNYNPFSSFGDRHFDDFFYDFFPPQNYSRKSLGSGVIINPEGYILTNEHVVSHATTIKITLIDKREYNARLVGADVKNDLAIIKIESDEKFPFVNMHTSSDLMIGETVIAIGNPFGLSHTVTTGIISSLYRTVKGEGDRVYSDFIQLDASINPGNSGGPLLNINGELIGVNTAIYQKAEGIGFAIPIDRAKRIVDDLINYGEVKDAWIGIFVQDISEKLAAYFGFKGSGGVVITKVFKKSPAEKEGLKVGDIITSFGNKAISGFDDYKNYILTYSADDKLNLKIFRNGNNIKFTLLTTEVPINAAFEIGKEWLGIIVSKITKKEIINFNLYTDEGVLITEVAKNSEVYSVGIRPGDVIRQINSAEISNISDFKTAIIAARKNVSVLLLIQRGRKGYYATLEP